MPISNVTFSFLFFFFLFPSLSNRGRDLGRLLQLQTTIQFHIIDTAPLDFTVRSLCTLQQDSSRTIDHSVAFFFPPLFWKIFCNSSIFPNKFPKAWTTFTVCNQELNAFSFIHLIQLLSLARSSFCSELLECYLLLKLSVRISFASAFLEDLFGDTSKYIWLPFYSFRFLSSIWSTDYTCSRMPLPNL